MRRGTSLAELTLALALLGLLLPALARPRPSPPGPDDGLALAMEAVLRDLGQARELVAPTPPAPGHTSRALPRLELVGPRGCIRYQVRAGRLERVVRATGEATWVTGWSIPLERALFQGRRLQGPGTVVRVRMLRGRDLLLSAAVVGSDR